MADEHKNAEAAAKAAEDASKAAAKSREEQLAESRKAADADTKAHYKRVADSQPTPTQEENDRAKLGFHSLDDLDSKDDHGAPSEAEARATAFDANAERERATAPKK